MSISRARGLVGGILLATLCACHAVRETPPAADLRIDSTTHPPVPADHTPAAPGAPRPAAQRRALQRRDPVLPAHDQPPAPLRGADVYRRILSRLADPPCVQDRVVQRWERTYARWPPRFQAGLEQALPLMALVVEELEAHALPGEFAFLPMVESGYRPAATHLGTAGMWQFAAATARQQGLRVSSTWDGRLAPLDSTRAAMRYLAGLLNRFGDWKLANMAFNAGENRLQRSLRDRPGSVVSAASHLPPGLSMITYEHLAKVQALACLVAHPERFGIARPDAHVVDTLHETDLPARLPTLDAFSTSSGIPGATLGALNPGFLGGRIAPDAPRRVLLPESALRRLASSAPGTAATVQAGAATSPSGSEVRVHVVRRGDTLGAIALRHRLRLRDLVQWNGIDPAALLQPGQRLRLEP